MAYELLPGQERFLALPHKYRAFVGGVGSGKTWVGALLAAVRFGSYLESGMVIAPTYRMLKDATQPALTEVLDSHRIPYVYNKGDEKLELESGAEILLRSGDIPDRLRGPNITWAWLDEMAMMRELVWKVVLGRLRVGNPQAWGTTTPAGMNWIYRRWVDLGDDRYGIAHASSRENIHLPDDFVRDLEADYSEVFAAQEIDGQFVAFEGLVYPEFNTEVHGFNHDLPDSWTRVRGIDFGYKNPFVVLWGAVDGDGRLWIYDEHYQRQELLEHHVKKIKERAGTARWTVSDHDAQEVAQLRSLGIDTIPAKKDVIVGVQAVKNRLKVQRDGKPRIFVHDRCVNVRRELGMYRWAESTGGTEKEEPVKEHDHACDALRYMVAELDLKPKARRVRVKGV